MKSVRAWKGVLRQNFTRLEPLLEFLEMAADKRKRFLNLPPFALNVPRRLAEKIRKNDLKDPLLLQFVPLVEESFEREGFSGDPVCDKAFATTPKLLHKYPGRALLLVTSACAMHCRFCFRQNFPYEQRDKSFDREFEYIAANPSIHEVILSGGDPLSLDTKMLMTLLNPLESMQHVKLIRFHTRFLLGVPERVTDDLIIALKSLSKSLVFVLHINHSHEIDDEVRLAVKRLKCEGITLLSQSVLLKGVNDSKQTLKSLFLSIVGSGITPYYLHKLDKVRGSSHFNVETLALVKQWLLELRDEMPGYAVPRFVEEVPHKLSKTLIN